MNLSQYLIVPVLLTASAINAVAEHFSELDREPHAWGLSLSQDGTYLFALGRRESHLEARGKYILKGGTITFRTFEQTSGEDYANDLNTLRQMVIGSKCTYAANGIAPRHSEYIRCEKGKSRMVLYNRQSSVVPGAEGKWDGADITVLAPTKAKVTSCLKIREKPSLTATAIPFRQTRPDDPGLEEKGCIPPGTEITVLARSTKKQKVQKWQNYWYVIDMPHNSHQWVFGEFLKLD